MAGQIIIVNGTSGSGKTTTCEEFVKRSDDFWLLYGIDFFLGSAFPKKFGHHGERSNEGFYAYPVDENDPEGNLRWGFGEWGKQGFAAFHEWVAAASRQNCNIIIDHILTTDPPILQDCIWRLQGLPVLFVTLKPPFEVLMERVASREIGARFSGVSTSEQVLKSRARLDHLRPWFYEAVYKNTCSDLDIDTVQHEPDAVCDLIEKRLAEGPGTAFEELRRQFPKV
ncbi:chloramphenicol phosphotransferase CPT family protein [Zhongshania aquimaris]|uniref:Chloramphenicol phosphotransferase CPT family protein n=1 Tax=Zhongshania aquimaris TaxID=2857107 RepID=A0ABS6VQS5_9GAMM|nr:chloramphenicol phosphotransferase CPT family protein [Zhongshania aquimaris]MBW2940678.1 chloramphenicol phosphotransferase CPT family protein [Zhongshania aquimaris]